MLYSWVTFNDRLKMLTIKYNTDLSLVYSISKIKNTSYLHRLVLFKSYSNEYDLNRNYTVYFQIIYLVI